ncbi:MAG: DUF4349 domain-containing protein, partial [Oscillospiraceae bacterium]|nr:DUF4349 domain-containing protein [Oscillospiraceae bacterium]
RMIEMKRKVSILLTALMLLSLLCACGAGSAAGDSAAMEESFDMEFFNTSASTAPSEPMADSMTAGGSMKGEGGEMDAGSLRGKGMEAKLIYTAEVNMESTDFDAAVAGLDALVARLGAYYERNSIYNHSANYRSGDYTVRVPAEKFEAFMSEIGTLCHVRSANRYVEDVSEVYYDTESRLTTYKTKLERLQHLLSQAESMEDIITIESAISETEFEIERLSGTLRGYDARISYSTVYLSLQEVYRLSNVETPPLTFGERMGNALVGGIENTVDSLERFAVWLAYNWITLLFYAAVICVVVYVVRRNKKGGWKMPGWKKEKKDVSSTPENEEKE